MMMMPCERASHNVFISTSLRANNRHSAQPRADLKPGMQGLKFVYNKGERQLRVTGNIKMI